MERKNKQARQNIVDVRLTGLPPSAVELEDAVIGACMLEPYTFERIFISLKPHMFYRLQNQILFQAMAVMNAAGQPIDILTVTEHLNRTKNLEEVGGAYGITKLTNAVVSTANIEAWSLIIQQKFINRELCRTCLEVVADTYEDLDCFDNCNKLQMSVDLLLSNLSLSHVFDIASIGVKFLETLDKRMSQNTDITGIPSGFSDMDSITHGWQPTDLIILAARPSVGKTAMAINIAVNAVKSGHPVGFWSLEMSYLQLIQRVIASESEIPLEQIQLGRLTHDEYKAVYATTMRIESLPMIIDDTAGLNILDFKNKARRLVKEHKLELIVIDYLQLMYGPPDGEKRTREQEISQISRELKKLAKEMHIPIIALSQLSRAVETRGGEKIPQLSDLRESGAIEQDADMVMFIYRPEYYDIKANDMGESTAGETMIKIAKHRNGRLGSVNLKGRFSIQKFYSANSMDLLRDRITHNGEKDFSDFKF